MAFSSVTVRVVRGFDMGLEVGGRLRTKNVEEKCENKKEFGDDERRDTGVNGGGLGGERLIGGAVEGIGATDGVQGGRVVQISRRRMQRTVEHFRQVTADEDDGGGGLDGGGHVVLLGVGNGIGRRCGSVWEGVEWVCGCDEGKGGMNWER